MNWPSTRSPCYPVFFFFFLFFFNCLLSRSISDHYLRSCGNVTCSRPQQKAPWLRIELGTSGTGVNHSTPAPVRSTSGCRIRFMASYTELQSSCRPLFVAFHIPLGCINVSQGSVWGCTQLGQSFEVEWLDTLVSTCTLVTSLHLCFSCHVL